MGYSREVYEEAVAALEQRRMDAINRAGALRSRMIARYPRLAEIEKEMSRSSLKVARAVLEKGNVEETVAAIRQENLKLQEEMAAILREAGETADNFEPRFSCPLCGDTGYANGKLCGCFSALLRETACQRLSKACALKLTSFEDMQLSYYPAARDEKTGISPRERMRSVLEYGRLYAENFSSQSPSLLLRGPTGTGKTHLSLAIAKTVTEKGFSVIYSTMQQLLHQLEKEHFGRADGNSLELCEQCDLLILDDLGTEFSTPFYTASLYTVINTRTLNQAPTIINTNLQQKQLLERYGEQLTSRITGLFQPLIFFGRDIRQLKLQEQW